MSNVLVVYESMFGNTAEVARAVARGARAVRCAELHEVSPSDTTDADLLVVGGPTHAFSMSRPATRHDAVGRGAEPSTEDRGIREWLSELPAHVGTPVATFDTRADRVRHLPGSAAKAAAKEARHHHGRVVDHSSFYVADTKGPLLPGELERAEAWGDQLLGRVVGAAPGTGA